MTTMTTTARTLRSTAPVAVAVAAATALGIAIGFWAGDQGSTATDESRVLSAVHEPSAGLSAYETAKFEQLAAADASATRRAAAAPLGTEARKLAQMDAADAAYAPTARTARVDVSAFKLDLLERRDAAIARGYVTKGKLEQAEQGVAAIIQGRTVTEMKLRQLEAQDAR